MSRKKVLYNPNSLYLKTYIQFELMYFLENEFGYADEFAAVSNKFATSFKIIYDKVLQITDGNLAEFLSFEDLQLSTLETKKCKKLLKRHNLLENVNQLYNGRFINKKWFYRWAVARLKFSVLGKKNSQDFFSDYVFSGSKETNEKIPSPILKFLSWDVTLMPPELYRKQTKAVFNRKLKRYMDEVESFAKNEGYIVSKNKGKFMRDIEFYCEKTFNSKTYFEIFNDTRFGENKISESMIKKSVINLRNLGDLP